MTKNHRELTFLRSRIPAFVCLSDCHDCCGPTTASSEEVAELPTKSEEEHSNALNDYSCPHLGGKGCEVYEDRPLICRLFGTTPRLACPQGLFAETNIDPEIEKRIYQYNENTRQVLV